ncbi:MAG: ABC transporter ATP-binding protein [Alphaproteobacteria bacterium]|nr:ABC transporter ATP-binding protein [Alphaproteobacteria bacterium]OJV14214.1 MAG: hypothetical protein BGO27_01790 [Alphaproteobacteria bacterium 33-17]
MYAGVNLSNVSVYGIDTSSKSLFLKHLVLGKKKASTDIKILENISLNINQGEKVGFIGTNGSGKSSLLKAIAGIYPPSQGDITVKGSVNAIIEMGLGFENELSGRDNIKLGLIYQGGLAHLTPDLEKQIIEFSELEEKIDIPFKYYSSGMISRLAFSISAFIDSDILLLDEVFAAGDVGFIEKSSNHMKKRLQNSAISIIVSHSQDLILDTCTRCIWLENGNIIADGDAEYIMKEYNLKCHSQNV